jgi:threonine synthase
VEYISTRGGVAPLRFTQAVRMGLAQDGGLLIPQHIPVIDADTLKRWAQLRFQDLALEVISTFCGEEDIPRADLRDLIERSYRNFSHAEITPVVNAGGLRILELFHGPTLAFKDVALQFLGNLFEYLLARDGGQLNILGATSGDTGSAAIYGVRGKPHIHIFILHPHQRVSPVQERQMTTVLDANVHNIALQGTFDDGQRIVKELFNDLSFKENFHLGAVNSINWARIVAQIVYYFYTWGRVTGGDLQQALSFSVPTGNFGDIFAAYVARRMGLPVKKLVLATNRNDILSRFVQHGAYTSDTVYPTLTPSMDIQVSSNFERYLYYLMDGDSAQVKNLMDSFARTGALAVDKEKLAQVQADFVSHAVSEEQTLATIQRVYADCGYILDPHSAVGVAAAQAVQEADAICLATAHPAKFGEAVAQALGHEAPLPAAMADLLERETRLSILPADAGAVKAFMLKTLA